jgi:hypothetical protein
MSPVPLSGPGCGGGGAAAYHTCISLGSSAATDSGWFVQTTRHSSARHSASVIGPHLRMETGSLDSMLENKLPDSMPTLLQPPAATVPR